MVLYFPVWDQWFYLVISDCSKHANQSLFVAENRRDSLLAEISMFSVILSSWAANGNCSFLPDQLRLVLVEILAAIG
jgi:hypothetical protein